jgi:hypothetical protein
MVQNNEEPTKSQPLTEEEMSKAVKQIVFDLGVDTDQARKWAEEAQEELINERNTKVTKEVVTCVADAKHIDDDKVPAELVARNHGTSKLPGADLANGIVNAVKNAHAKVKN